jgi:hypothetical protein
MDTEGTRPAHNVVQMLRSASTYILPADYELPVNGVVIAVEQHGMAGSAARPAAPESLDAASDRLKTMDGSGDRSGFSVSQSKSELRDRWLHVVTVVQLARTIHFPRFRFRR